jgi:hypothetical protein
VGIAGCRWYLQIKGRGNSSAAGLANSYVYPFCAMGKVPIGSPAFNSFLVPTGGRLCGLQILSRNSLHSGKENLWSYAR